PGGIPSRIRWRGDAPTTPRLLRDRHADAAFRRLHATLGVMSTGDAPRAVEYGDGRRDEPDPVERGRADTAAIALGEHRHVECGHRPRAGDQFSRRNDEIPVGREVPAERAG